MRRPVLDPSEWGRVSGSVFDFFATDEEIQQLLNEVLVPGAEHWRLIGVDRQAGPFVFPADRLLENVMNAAGQRRTELHLWLPAQLPGLATSLDHLGRSASPAWTNGLIGLGLSHLIRGPMPEGHSTSFIALNSAVGNLQDGRAVEFEESKRLYERMKRRLQRQEACRAIFISANGLEAPTRLGVSPGILAAVESGLRLYQHRPAPTPRT